MLIWSRVGSVFSLSYWKETFLNSISPLIEAGVLGESGSGRSLVVWRMVSRRSKEASPWRRRAEMLPSFFIGS